MGLAVVSFLANDKKQATTNDSMIHLIKQAKND
jgi:hypothetical protein